MFNFKNKITSWYYKYTDELLLNNLERKLHFNRIVLKNDSCKYLFMFNIYVGIPLLSFLVVFLFFDHLFPNSDMQYMQYLAMIWFGYILLALLTIIIQFIVFSIRRKLFKNLLFILYYIICVFIYALLEQFLRKYNYFSLNKSIVDVTVMCTLFIIVRIFIRKKYHK